MVDALIQQDEHKETEFGDPAYWEAYYQAAPSQGEESWDWLADWAVLQPVFEQLGQNSVKCRVLHLGVGNSELPEDMWDGGYVHQTCVDVSPAVVAHMTTRCRAKCPSIRWLVGDVTDLQGSLQDEMFDLVVGKCLVDALVCADDRELLIAKYLHEAWSRLAPDGIFVSLEAQRPQRMLPWFEHQAFSWCVRVLRLLDSRGRPSGDVMYICTKQEPTEAALQGWPVLLQSILDGVSPLTLSNEAVGGEFQKSSQCATGQSGFSK
ncbi:unnamed protein product [Polarella glacialis]|uniref:Methyltransferase domain-containing protein n=1 Tax=Polarella glacialis TaxID=89957 RepID=A0A813JLP1_POLGL|nr:unnamed protein product [Polarella glacialis]